MSFSVRTAAKRKAKAESTTAVETKRKCGTHSAACVAWAPWSVRCVVARAVG